MLFGEGMALWEIYEFMSAQPDWVNAPQLKQLTLGTKNTNDLEDLKDEIKDKRAQLNSLTNRLYALECEKDDLDEICRRERIAMERNLVAMMRDKYQRDENIRVELEARVAEQEAEMERLQKRCENEIKFREEALRQADKHRMEIKALEDRCVQDEAIIGKLSDAEREYMRQLEEMQMKAESDDHAIMVFKENERQMRSDIESLRNRMAQLERGAAEDGATLVQMRDTEREMRGEIDRLLAELRMKEEQEWNDEQAITTARENMKNLQMDNDNLAAQNSAFEHKLEEDALAMERLRSSENSMRRRLRELDEAHQEIDRLRSELERQRKIAREAGISVSTTTTRTTRDRVVRSPSPTSTVHNEQTQVVTTTRNSSPVNNRTMESHVVSMRSAESSPRAALQEPLRYRRLSSGGGQTTRFVESTRIRHSPTTALHSPTRSPNASRISRSMSTTSVRHDNYVR
eukprot:TRINITY_DN13364_c0_g1_i1.p1 TRINITY_DN13364_c0_g1~~TRINITY_DN13364_c0_g1_i1.p1  ORF type:complete len:460 (-),score=81.73 TRINITY_DN13364_c0_g1_i1:792-2171(-)